MTEKTHWLQNPNKNYLGHWDLPNGQDIILTIASAGWEEVKNPITRTSEAKRVIRFAEKNDWIKPFICNEINAQTICKMTGEKFMEDCAGRKIKIGVGTTKVAGQEVDCLRIRAIRSVDLNPKVINPKQADELNNLIASAGLTAEVFCKSMKIKESKDLPASKFEEIKTRLVAKAMEVAAKKEEVKDENNN